MMNSIKVNYVALGLTVGVALLIIVKVYYNRTPPTVGGGTVSIHT